MNAYAPSDAAVAGPLAFKLNAPILLTDADKLSETTLNEIKTLGAKNITIIGGTGVITTAVENSLKDLGYQVIRYSGSDRYQTAASIANSFDKFTQAVIVNGEGSMNALASASWAAANKAPILYTESNVLTQATQDAITKAGVTNAIVIGGEGAVSKDVFNILPGAKRYGGNDRYETAANLAAGLQPKANLGKVKNLSFVGGTGSVTNLQQEVMLRLAGLETSAANKAVFDAVTAYFNNTSGWISSDDLQKALTNLVGINTKALAFGWGRPAYPQEGWSNKGYAKVNTLYDAVQSYYANMPSDSYKISLPNLKAAIDANSSEYVVLDVRQKDAYDKGHIKGAINVPYGSDIAANLDNIRALAQGKTLVVACYTGQTAGQTDSLLNLAGIKTRSLLLK